MAPDSLASASGTRIRRRLGGALERVLDRLLALDPAARAALAPLQGRRVVLELAAPAVALSLTVADGRLRVGPAGGAADLSIRAPLSALAARALGAAGTGRIAISGDAELAQQLQRLARDWRPDIEGALTDAFGDVLGYQLARTLLGALGAARRSGDRLARDLVDYLVEERGDVIGRAEIEAFCEDVDQLRDDLERLAHRVGRLGGRPGRGA
ncbi:MAG TPA: SCP2 sterol-binding domain-containing protein [Xanthomonadaceae bacterium]|nr:SCP2 sterol-binding domain-containing protein [Xanthomonadaceae bacterium]